VAVKLFATFQTRPQFRPLEIDVRMLAVALIVSIGCGVACGLLPALQGGRRRVSDALAQGSQSASASRSGRQLRNGLVVLEVSLAVVLLVGAGLMVTSVVKLLRIDPGFDASELVRIQTNWGPRSGITFQTEAAAISQLHERFAAMPGIKSVGVLASGGGEILSLNGAADPVVMLVRFAGVENADYFRAAGIPLLGGRRLDRSDAGEQMRNAIVNRALANAAWPGEDPIGKTLEMPWRGLTYRVVGVVGDMRTALDREQHATLYLPFAHLKAGSVPEFVIRSNREPGELVPALRRALHEFNPNMRNPQIVAYRDMLFEGTRARRAYRDYLIGFASIGLVLSALGIYGVLSHSVARRTREIGIRMAVGADRGDVVRMVVGDGLRLAAVGIALGLMLSFWMTQLLRHQLYEVDATNVTVLVTVTVVLAATVLIAALLPARRAAAVNPIEALKA
jgi:predicted permease